MTGLFGWLGPGAALLPVFVVFGLVYLGAAVVFMVFLSAGGGRGPRAVRVLALPATVVAVALWGLALWGEAIAGSARSVVPYAVAGTVVAGWLLTAGRGRSRRRLRGPAGTVWPRSGS